MPATVHIDCVVLNDAANPADFIVCCPVTSIDSEPSADVDVQVTASGRGRAIRHSTVVREPVSVKCDALDRATAARIRAWVGRLVCYRDPFGRRVFGVFDSSPMGEVGQGTGLVSITFTVQPTSEPL